MFAYLKPKAAKAHAAAGAPATEPAIADFDADIEITLGKKIVKINYPCYIFIPKNIMHCPLDIKRVGKPFLFIDARITKEASVRPAKTAKVKAIKYIAKNDK